VQRAGFAGDEGKGDVVDAPTMPTEKTDYEECLACQ
jgi:hypothetical protein